LRQGDLGAVVEVCSASAIGVEFVAASGRTQALVTLRPEDVREVGDDDLVAVRPVESSAASRKAQRLLNRTPRMRRLDRSVS
jgi:hypothetical protein